MLILLEAVLLGVLGTLAGLGLGILLGRGAVQLVTRTINDLFFVVSVREITVPWWTLAKGAVTGVAAAVLAAALPAWEATSVPPAGALQRSSIEERSTAALPWVTAAAIALLGIGLALLLPEWSLVIAFAGLFAVIVGAALLAPLLTRVLMSADRSPRSGRDRADGPAHHHPQLEPHLGGRGRADGRGERDHRRGHHDRQLPLHGRPVVGRGAASRHLCVAAIVDGQPGLDDARPGDRDAVGDVSGHCADGDHARSGCGGVSAPAGRG